MKKHNNNPSNHNPCDGCSICCEHVALPLDTPRSKDDWHHIIWYVMHKNVFVYKDHDGDWYIEFKSPCKALDPKGWCTIHPTRPNICREYSIEDCEKNGTGNFYSVMFKKKEDVLKYIKKHTIIKDL